MKINMCYHEVKVKSEKKNNNNMNIYIIFSIITINGF